jgi:PAS domain S-box-containing protein
LLAFSRGAILFWVCLAFAGGILISGIVIYQLYRGEIDGFRSSLQRAGTLIVRLGMARSLAEPAVLQSDVTFLSRDLVLTQWLARPNDETRAAVETQFLEFLRHKAHYDQVRFIDIRGVERIRVDRSQGAPGIVARDKLQNKADRPYVAETLTLERGEIYISSIDANVENGVVERPIKAVLRLAVPLFGPDGVKRGVVVLNYRAQIFLDNIKSLASASHGDLWLVNGIGNWLMEPNRDAEQTLAQADQPLPTFAKEYPSVWERIVASSGQDSFFDGGNLYTFAAIGMDALTKPGAEIHSRFEFGLPGKTLILLERVPSSVISGQEQAIRDRFVAIGAAWLLILLLCAVIVGSFWISRKTALATSRRSDANFRAMFAVSPDALLLTDRTGTIVQANEQASTLFGYDRDALIRMPVDKLVPASVREKHGALRAGYFRNADVRRMGADRQLWAVRSDGTEFPADIYLSLVANDDADLVFASVRDMTERHEREQTIAGMAERLARDNEALAAANAELDGFTYSVSHDLRAPLRSMTGFCKAVMEDYGERLDETGKDYLRRISDAAGRMGRLIDDLLALSRVSRKEMRKASVSLSDLAESIAEQLRAVEPKRDVTFNIQPGVTVTGDEDLLNSALENLLGNAWKYTAKTPRAVIEFGVSNGSEGPTYFVRDNGVGFDMTYADKIFEPFQRLHKDSEFEGTGIGLASVFNILRRHGGRIWAESESGLGTTMHFTVSGDEDSSGREVMQ